MYTQNLHTHGILCDGKNEYEDTVKRAMEIGFDSIGFSMHSYISCVSSGGGTTGDHSEEYKKRIAELKEKYKGKIDVFCGLEWDRLSDVSLQGYDYVIGALHYLKTDVGYRSCERDVAQTIAEAFHGDEKAYFKAYYRQYAEMPQVAERTPDVVAHFDLVAKFAGKIDYFDAESKEYKDAALECLHALAEKIRVFEVNTGGMVRGYRDYPYLPPFLLKELKTLGCDVTISSDCHDNRFLNAYFAEAEELIRSCGFDHVVKLTENGFKGVKL